VQQRWQEQQKLGYALPVVDVKTLSLIGFAGDETHT